MGTSRSSSIALAAGATLAALLLAEIFLRSFQPVDYRPPVRPLSDEAWEQLLHRPSSLPGLAYELAPDRELIHQGVAVRTNRHGMRDRDPAAPGTPGIFRVAALGDSVTFGYGVAAEQAWPKQLERLLNAAARPGEPRYEVLNFGVAGYSTRDEALVLEHKVLAWEPDLVVVGYSLNDPETTPLQPLQQHFTGVRWWQHSHLLRLVAQWRHERRVASDGGGSYIRALYAPGQASWRSVEAGFARIAALTRARGISGWVAIFPQLKRLRGGGYPDGDLHLQVAAEARRAGLHAIDLQSVLAALPPGELHLPRDVLHPTPAGHRAAAGALHRALRADPTALALGR